MMRLAAIAGCLLFAVAATASAGQQASDPKAARATLHASHGQVAAQGAEVDRLKARVDALEADSHAASRSLDEKDRKIAELQRQLEARQKP